MIERFLLLRWVLSSIVEGKSLLAEVTVTGSETMDLDTNETRCVYFSQCFFLGWMCYAMNQSWRRLWEMIYELLVLFHDRGQSSHDECHGVEVGRYWGSLFRADGDLDIFPECEHSLFLDMSAEVKKEDTFNWAKTCLNSCHPYCLWEWHLVST